MPVLAEEAIKGAGLIKDGQVFVAIFCLPGVGKFWVTSPSTTGTYPISNAVGRQGVMVPANITLTGAGTDKPAFLVSPEPAIASPLRRN